MNRGLPERGWGAGAEGRPKVRSTRKSRCGNQEVRGFQEETEVERRKASVRGLGS